MADLVPIKRALISVSDKTGLAALGKALARAGVDILSTGGTATALRDAGVAVRDVASLTGYPEMMGGRVKTLHPRVHGGLLADRDDVEHRVAMDGNGILPIDLLVVNLYPFEETVAAQSAAAAARTNAGQAAAPAAGGDEGADTAAGTDAETAEAIETIDIGGPAMIRSAAKNHAWVTVVTDPEDYTALTDELAARDGATTAAFRRRMAGTAFARTAAYDTAVAGWMAGGRLGGGGGGEEDGRADGEAGAAEEPAPRRRSFTGRLAQTLRYGENPHQTAAFYRDGTDRIGVGTARLLQGKALSWNNINDTDAAFELASEFDPAEGAVCVIVKHANPCGVARGATPLEAYRRAFDCDRTSAYGGIVAFNRPVDRATAAEMADIFTEVVIAPGFETGAAKVFGAKANLRVMETGGMADPRAPGPSVRQVAGGFLVQDRDTGRIDPTRLRTVTRREPSGDEMADMLFAWVVAKHVRSNAIVYARGGATVGIGAGQMSRVDSAGIAARKARAMYQSLNLPRVPTEGAAVASDAFFPFADGLLEAVEAGATAVIQPGGSKRDDEVIRAADEAGLAMVFTDMRHFRH